MTTSGPALVTGASGFAGSHLMDHLRDDGTAAVGWDRSVVDLLDRDVVRARIQALRPSMIYHCAGAPHVGHAWADTTQALASNVLATHYLLDAVRRAGMPCRILITGSATVYAASTRALSEDDPLLPNNPYGLSKLAQEQLGEHAGAEDGVDIVIARPFNHTGPRQRPAFAAPNFARQFAMIEAGQTEPALQVGNLDARRDLTDVRDTVRAYQLLMHAGRPGVTYNVCSGRAYAISELVDGLRARVRVKVRLEVKQDLLRRNDTPLLLGSPARLQADTGWSPAISFDQMLDDLLDHWRDEVRPPA